MFAKQTECWHLWIFHKFGPKGEGQWILKINEVTELLDDPHKMNLNP